MDFNACSTASKSPVLVVKENKSCFEVVNSSRLSITKVKVDGCLINDARMRCDWIIEVGDPVNRALFVELKGCDVDKAIVQLKATLVHTAARYSESSKQCFAVTTRIPKHGDSVRKKCIDFHRSTNVTLSIRNIKSSFAV